jgi:hypothetical protein
MKIEVADFLQSAVPLVNDEPGTVSWFAIQEGQSSFATRDAIDISLRWSAADCAGPRWCSGSARAAPSKAPFLLTSLSRCAFKSPRI